MAADDKKCSQCGDIKTLNNFQVRKASKDGLTAACKDCLRAYDRKRFLQDPKVRERHKRYQKTPAGKASISRHVKKWAGNNPEKRKANIAVGNAVRDGRLKKPTTCTHCLKASRLHGHHEDYSKPLDVVWLCDECHRALHAFYKTVGRKIEA